MEAIDLFQIGGMGRFFSIRYYRESNWQLYRVMSLLVLGLLSRRFSVDLGHISFIFEHY